MSDPSMIIGEWGMRRGDRLPMLSVVIEDDATPPKPANLTGGTAFLLLRANDGVPALDLPPGQPPIEYVDGWLALQAYIYDAVNGVVVYDWPNAQTAGLTTGFDEMMIAVYFPDGSSITAPSDREARLIVRPELLPPVF